MKELVENVNFLVLTRDPLNSITSTTINNISVLAEDLTGMLLANRVYNEQHEVNVPGNKLFIRPGAGSFYTHDLIIVNPSTGNSLIRGVDYEIVGINRPKTRVTEHTSAVYEYIKLLQPYVGILNVSYRAFGGEVSVKDINAIKDVIADLVRMMADGLFLTADTLPYSLPIIQILERLATLEDHVHHYVTAHHRYVADSTGKHWFTIAELHLDDWTPDVITAAQIQLALKSPSRRWAYEAMISVNLTREHERARVNVISSLDKHNHFSIGEYTNIDERNIPEIRIVWNDDAGDLSGGQIQIGMHMEAGQHELLSVYDKSGNGSDIVVRPNIAGTDIVYDDSIRLPDNSLWVSTDTIAEEARALICPEEGYLIWGGAMPATLMTEWTEMNNTIRLDDFKIANIKKTTFYYYDRIEDRMILSSIEHQWDDRNVIHDTSIFFAQDLCGVQYKLYDGGFNNARLELKHTLGSNSEDNDRFDLRQIVVHL